MLADLVVKGRVFLQDGRIERAAVSVRDGKVVAVGATTEARRVLDVADALVVPGAIDPHVHFRDPGNPEKEDFASGTKAAALGGVTTVLDMPNTSPPTFTRAALDEKRRIALSKACVDFGLHLGLDADGASLPLLPEATSMKVYLGATTGNLLVRDMGLVRRALVAAAGAGRTVAFHTESQGCLDRHAHLADDTYPSHARARPPVCEEEAIDMLAEAAAGTGARVHVAHLSTALGVAALARTGFTSEVCPHHLLFAEDRLVEGRFKMNPPLRAQTDLDELWRALADGRVQCLASDHAPHTPQEKAASRQKECPAGVPGVQTLLPVLLPHAERAGGLARLLAASVAAGRVFSLPAKGALAPGFDADLAIYRLDDERPIRAADMASRAGWTPFEGMPAVFPRTVMVRGDLVVDEGVFVGRAGTGRFVRP